MSAQAAKPKAPGPAPARKVTLEDVRRKAEDVQNIAREEVQRVTRADGSKLALYAAAGVVVALGLAYYLGTRAAKRPKTPPPSPEPFAK